MDLQEEAPPPSSTESQPPLKEVEKNMQEHQVTPTARTAVDGSAARECLEDNNESSQTPRSDIDPILLKIVQDRANQNEPMSHPRERRRGLRRSKTIEAIDRTQEPPQTQSRTRRGLRRVKTMEENRTAPPATRAALGGSTSRDCLQDNSKTSQTSRSDIDPVLVKIVQDRANKHDPLSKQQQVADEEHQAVVHPCHPQPHRKDTQEEAKLPGAFPVQPTSREDNQSFHSSRGWSFHQSWGSFHGENGFGQSSTSWRQSSFHSGSNSNVSLHDDCSEHSCHSRCVGGPAASLPIAAEVVEDVDMEAEIERRVKEEIQKSSSFTRRNSELQHSTADRTDTNNQETSSELIQGMFGATATWRSGSEERCLRRMDSTGSEDIRRITSVLKKSLASASQESETDVRDLAKSIRAALKRGNSFKSVDTNAEHQWSSQKPKWKLLFCCFSGKKKNEDWSAALTLSESS